MGYHEDLLRLYKFADPKGFRNLKKTSRRRDSVLHDSGHYSTTAWGALNKCWKGFKIAKSEWDMKKMFQYAKGIRRLQRELKISVPEFPQFGLIGRITTAEEEQNLPGQSYAQTEEYFRRRRQDWVDPGSYV